MYHYFEGVFKLITSKLYQPTWLPYTVATLSSSPFWVAFKEINHESKTYWSKSYSEIYNLKAEKKFVKLFICVKTNLYALRLYWSPC